MKIRISAFLFLLSMICVSVLNAQSSDWLWAKTFGGPNSNRINDYADASDGARVIECDTEGNCPIRCHISRKGEKHGANAAEKLFPTG